MEVHDYAENYSTGWIKSYRSTIKKGWYKKSEYFHLWHHLLYKANHEGIEFMFAGENVILKPGQFVTGRKVLSEETGIHESKIERLLNFFESKECQIEQQKTNKYRVITILNWHLYQNTEQPLNNKRTTTEQQLNTNKNDKNKKKDKNTYSPNFEAIWTKYPSRVKRKEAEKHFLASVKTEQDFEDINKALNNYLQHLANNDWKKPQNGSTWFNNWQDWINWEEPNQDQQSVEIVWDK